MGVRLRGSAGIFLTSSPMTKGFRSVASKPISPREKRSVGLIKPARASRLRRLHISPEPNDHRHSQRARIGDGLADRRAAIEEADALRPLQLWDRGWPLIQIINLVAKNKADDCDALSVWGIADKLVILSVDLPGESTEMRAHNHAASGSGRGKD